MGKRERKLEEREEEGHVESGGKKRIRKTVETDKTEYGNEGSDKEWREKIREMALNESN